LLAGIAWPAISATIGRLSIYCDDLKEVTMLELRPNCECCDKDLAADSAEVFICSFECTFCRDCTENVLKSVCPNCGGELVIRPRRPAGKLEKFPASTKRVFNKNCRDTGT
jgi:hypothetical protein